MKKLMLPLALIFLAAAPLARAGYVSITAEPNTAEKFFLADEKDPVNAFSGNVGGNNLSFPKVNAVAGAGSNVTVDISSGFATIKPGTKPDTPSPFTSLTFTPVDPIFEDFLTHFQLANAGSVTITVLGNNPGDVAESFTFTNLPANSDVGPFGIIATAGSGDTIQWVKIETDAGNSFLEVKQVEFSEAVNPVPEPSSMIIFGIGSLGLMGYGWRKRR